MRMARPEMTITCVLRNHVSKLGRAVGAGAKRRLAPTFTGYPTKSQRAKKFYSNGVHMKYAGFWSRFGALWLDFAIFLPLMIINLWANSQFRLYQLFYFIPGILIGIWYNIYLVGRHGGTPGKLILNLKITKVDGTDIGYWEAFLRASVSTIFGIVLSLGLISATLSMADAEYFSLGWQERALELNERAPGWYQPASTIHSIWIWKIGRAHV